MAGQKFRDKVTVLGRVDALGGLFSRGTPLFGPTTGNVFHVDSGHAGASDTNSGKNPNRPLATIDAAIGKCTASNGDIILVAPGHAETVIAAASIVCDVAGVAIVGLGWGNIRPTITFGTATTADIDIDAASVSITNFRFINTIAALAAPIDVNAAGFTIEDCDFYVSAADKDVDITIITDANGDDITVRRCNFFYDYSRAATAVTSASTEVIRLVGADRATVEDCYMAGNFSTAAINGITTASGDIKISRNRIYNDQTANVAGIIDLVAGCTGVLDDNVGFHGYATDLATTIDPASCAMVRNYFSNVVTEAGGLVGTAST